MKFPPRLVLYGTDRLTCFALFVVIVAWDTGVADEFAPGNEKAAAGRNAIPDAACSKSTEQFVTLSDQTFSFYKTIGLPRQRFSAGEGACRAARSRAGGRSCPPSASGRTACGNADRRPGCRSDWVDAPLCPSMAMRDRVIEMLTPQLAGVAGKQLGAKAADLSRNRGEIVAALDLPITGI
ncbi:MAG TPA: CcdB family protein [Methylococcaceae bacterium]|nr:CcdB family protein [Methylococcaceae bacterium]